MNHALLFRRHSFAAALTGCAAMLVGQTAIASPSAARKAEVEAFDQLHAREYCAAARAFMTANAESAQTSYVFNAAIAADKAKDYLLAERLMTEVSAATKGRDAAVEDFLATFRARSASGPGRHCPHATVDVDDKKALVALIRDLELHIAALENQKRAPESEQLAGYTIPVLNSAWTGAKKGDIDLVIFTDYQCPFCARVHPLVNALKEDARTKARVRIIYKHFPLSFHRDAKPAAVAALAAREQGMDAFWAFSEKLFAQQRNLTAEQFSISAQDAGLNVKRFEKDLRQNKKRYEAEIDRDMLLGKNEIAVRGTPTLFVNGWRLKERTVDGVLEMAQEHPQGAGGAKSVFRRVMTK